MRLSRILAIGSLGAACNGAACNVQAAILNVPATYPTIQSAINAASDGDEVVVAPGTYFENIDFLGKAITVRASVPDDPQQTMIDGGGTATVVKFISGEGPDSQLIGVALRNGSSSSGGDILILNADPTVSGCDIEDSSAAAGAGVYIWGSPAFIDCRFRNNSGTVGGGAFIIQGSPTFENCRFVNNSGTSSSAVVIYDGTPLFSNCLFKNNTGGSGAVVGYAGTPGFISCEWDSNNTPALFLRTHGLLANCLFHDHATTVLGVVSILTGTTQPNPVVTIGNCTIVDNTGPAVTADSTGGSVLVLMANSIVRGDPAPIQTSGPSTTFLVRFSNIEGGYAGAGNIDVLPLFKDFANDDFHLSSDSPCIDAGDNVWVHALANGLDFDGNPRFMNVASVADTGLGSPPIVDMGAYEAMPEVRYVKADATGSANGLTWADAYNDLQDALDAAAANPDIEEIWVAAGTYKPDRGSGDRTLSFNMLSGVSIIGGFTGDESSADEYDPLANQTILSGAIGAGGTSDNSYHVVRASNVDASGKLIGFIVQRGNANGSNLTSDDRGAGILIDGGGGPTIRECWIRQNECTTFGGGVCSTFSDPIITRTRFSLNVAGTDGGGVTVFGGLAQIANCIFSGNTADNGGALIVYSGGTVDMTNCTLFANAATSDSCGGAYVLNGTLESNNTIAWGNTGTSGTTQEQQMDAMSTATLIVNYSCLQGWDGTLGGVFNFGHDPRFVDADGPDNTPGNSDDDLRLQKNSRCIDTSHSSALHPSIQYDYDGNPRFFDDTGMPNLGNGPIKYLDRGAFEASHTSCLGDIDANGIVNVNDMLAVINAWGMCSMCFSDLDGNGMVNVNDLLAVINTWGTCP